MTYLLSFVVWGNFRAQLNCPQHAQREIRNRDIYTGRLVLEINVKCSSLQVYKITQRNSVSGVLKCFSKLLIYVLKY